MPLTKLAAGIEWAKDLGLSCEVYKLQQLHVARSYSKVSRMSSTAASDKLSRKRPVSAVRSTSVAREHGPPEQLLPTEKPGIIDSGSQLSRGDEEQDHESPFLRLPESGKEQDVPTLVLMRHGESMWNDLKLFTGDVDIPLTEKGVHEALAGGRSVAEIDFDMIFTSRLIRSKQTALLAMTQNKHKSVPVIVRGGYYGRGKTGDANRLRLREAAAKALIHARCRMIPVYADPALNERCYGDLQGMNKEEATEEFGKEQVQKWRRSHDTRPPHGESLMDTWRRSVEFFSSTVEPRLKEGNDVLVVSHGNVLRCIISYICGLSESEMLRLQVITALPYAFCLNGDAYAQCCAIQPSVDPQTNKPFELPLGPSSVLKLGEVDSLI